MAYTVKQLSEISGVTARTLRFYEEQDFHDIANTMNISIRAVYKLIYKGLDNLQSHLVQSNIDLSFLLVLFLVTLV